MLALVAIGQFLGMTLWFSATAAPPRIAAEFEVGTTGVASLTIAAGLSAAVTGWWAFPPALGALRVVPNDGFKAAAEAQGFPCPDVIVDGEVIEVDPPRKLVTTWRMLMDPTMAAEGFTRLTWEIEETQGGVSKLTVVHDVEGAPQIASLISGGMEDQGAGGGWPQILSSLKTLLETGKPLES